MSAITSRSAVLIKPPLALGTPAPRLAASSIPPWTRRNRSRWYTDATKAHAASDLAGKRSSASILPKIPANAADLPASGAPTPATPSAATTIPPEQAPLVPPSPSKTQTSPPSSIPHASDLPPSRPPASPSPPRPRAKRRGLRRLIYLFLAGALSYAGAVFYALRSDNFHDFFTEYIPFGEEAVLYLEEQSFRKKFPNAQNNHAKLHPSAHPDTANKVTIPSKSGISWKITDDTNGQSSDVKHKGRHMSALDTNESVKESVPTQSSAQQAEKTATKGKKMQADTSAMPDNKARDVSKDTTQATSTREDTDRAPVIPPVRQVSPLEVPRAEEPLVQELATVVNDLITVINADSADASNKYSAPIDKAKDALVAMGSKIEGLREAEQKAAQEKIAEAHRQFDESAKELVRRIDAARNEEVAQYREEFESEKEKLTHQYSDKLKTDLERAQELSDQRIKNELAEQGIELRRRFGEEIKSLVERERQGRLSKISELSEQVKEMRAMTADWNGVIDSNLATQKLQIAIDSVRSVIGRATTLDDAPRPFVRELAALKEVADEDAVVEAAIATIDPAAYQRGIPSPAQLIERFRQVSGEVRKAALLPEQAGLGSHLASYVASKMMFKRAEPARGDDVESVLSRTETLLEEGDLDGAAREMNALHGWAALLSRDWLGECRKVLEVRQALEVIETEARLQCLRVE